MEETKYDQLDRDVLDRMLNLRSQMTGIIDDVSLFTPEYDKASAALLNWQASINYLTKKIRSNEKK